MTGDLDPSLSELSIDILNLSFNYFQNFILNPGKIPDKP